MEDANYFVLLRPPVGGEGLGEGAVVGVGDGRGSTDGLENQTGSWRGLCKQKQKRGRGPWMV